MKITALQIIALSSLTANLGLVGYMASVYKERQQPHWEIIAPADISPDQLAWSLRRFADGLNQSEEKRQ